MNENKISITPNTNSTNKFDTYMISRNICEESTFTIHFSTCCIHPFTFNYLHSLGFQHIQMLPMFFRKEASDRVMINNKNTTKLGCYGLKIIQNQEKYRSKLSIPYKTKLYSTVMQYCIQNNISNECKLFLPITYHLKVRSDRRAFFKLLPCNEEPNNEWILKHNDLHSAQGIKFIHNSNYVRWYYLNRNELMSIKVSNTGKQCFVDYTNQSQTVIYHKRNKVLAQEWIQNPLKINGCKFQIRSYFFVVNFMNPFIVLYANSFVSKAADSEQVLTNLRIQKEKYDESIMDDITWNMQQIDEHFESLNVTKMIEEIKSIGRIVYLASFEKDIQFFNVPNEEQQFFFMAFDMLLTNDYQIKLTEVNSRPGTSLIPKKCFDVNYNMKNNWICKFGKGMMEEMVNIEIELAIKKKNGDKIDQLDSVKTFQPIIWQY